MYVLFHFFSKEFLCVICGEIIWSFILNEKDSDLFFTEQWLLFDPFFVLIYQIFKWLFFVFLFLTGGVIAGNMGVLQRDVPLVEIPHLWLPYPTWLLGLVVTWLPHMMTPQRERCIIFRMSLVNMWLLFYF